MLNHPAILNLLVFLAVFALTGGVIALCLYFPFGANPRALARLRDLSAGDDRSANDHGWGWVTDTLGSFGRFFVPAEGPRRQLLQSRLALAGFHGPSGLQTFKAISILISVLAGCAGFLVSYLLAWDPQHVAILGFSGVCAGILAPGLWLDRRKKQRQAAYRRALPDALDMMVLCLEGGISLTAAIQRVTDELQSVHPLLGNEMAVVQREMQFGLSAGEALRKFGERWQLDDVVNLASVLLQSERYGASVVKALKIHADTCRLERQQQLEEAAQSASVKILFPTLLCIFPAIFIVILGPAAYQMAAMFSGTP
jgi:tight adherence protein C